MCMIIESPEKLGFEKINFNEKGEAFCYKIVKKTCWPDGFVDYFSPYNSFRYELGEEVVSNRKNIGLSSEEKISNRVDEGLHLFIDMDDIGSYISFLQRWDSLWHRMGLVVLKCLCKKEDLVGVGVWGDDKLTKQAVFMKVIPIEEIVVDAIEQDKKYLEEKKECV